jgi:hypothetical protein
MLPDIPLGIQNQISVLIYCKFDIFHIHTNLSSIVFPKIVQNSVCAPQKVKISAHACRSQVR